MLRFNPKEFEGPFTRQKRRNGSGRNEHRFQQNLTVYTRKFCKGTGKRMARSSEIRGTDKDRLHVVFFETETDRASDMKLLRLVRMRLRKKTVGTEPIFILSVPKKDHRRLSTLF